MTSLNRKILRLSSKFTASFQKKKRRVSLLFQPFLLYLRTSRAEKKMGHSSNSNKLLVLSNDTSKRCSNHNNLILIQLFKKDPNAN
jgi:hypothetical protein